MASARGAARGRGGRGGRGQTVDKGADLLKSMTVCFNNSSFGCSSVWPVQRAHAADYRDRPYMVVFVDDDTMRDIQAGLKTVESRKYRGLYTCVTSEWLLCVRTNLYSTCCWVEVEDLDFHKSHFEAARCHSKTLFPRVDFATITDAQREYLSYDMYSKSARSSNAADWVLICTAHETL